MIRERFITYYRVSTDRQGRSGLGLEAQQEAVRQFLVGRPADLIAEFIEIESGSKNDRPNLKEALAACQREKATLLIAKLDRLARSVAFISALMEAKTNFLAVDMPHASRLVLHVMAAFAEHDREMIRERTRAALAAAKARGVQLGANGAVLAQRHKAGATAYAFEVQDAVIAATQAGARTTREIADHLNAVRLPSRQGGRWHPANVARVLRRLTERLALDRGLDWAFCDTDSMALAKPDDMTDKIFENRARNVQTWFTPLNPYAEKGSLLKIEDENFQLKGGKASDQLQPLYCYAVSPKRYVLFNLDKQGRPVIRKTLAHGLGHLLQPLERERVPTSIPKPVIDLEDMEIKTWQYCFWYRIVEAALAGNHDNPEINDLPGFDRPAATRYGATTPKMLRWFKSYNVSRESYRDRVRPFNFTLRFYQRFELGGKVLQGDSVSSDRVTPNPPERVKPIAPYDRNVARAARSCWDRGTGQPINLETLESYWENLIPYPLHPDSKFLNASYDDRGVTARRHVVVAGAEHIGKEADRLEPQLMDGLDPDAAIIYGKSPEGVQAKEQDRHDKLAGAKLSDIERATGITRKTLARARNRGAASRKRTLKEIDRGINEILSAKAERRLEQAALLERARAEVVRVGGIRPFARLLRTDPSNLAKMLNDNRRPSRRLIEKLEDYFGLGSTTSTDT